MAGPTVLAALNTTALLKRMRTDLLKSGRLGPATVTWMYATYGAHTGTTAWALLRRSGEIPLPATAVWCGRVLALGGTGMLLAGVNRFSGPGQLSGTDVGSQITGGVYRYSRNPQYAGYLLQLGGLALARRSAVAGVLTLALAAAYRWWIPVEEAHLEARFGKRYRIYLEHTPRWLGIPQEPD